ncbi:unnamed protein product [Paramecium octaurelia]|uniref:Tetratricopeptide repeat protein n=1 Tax=Paramecium octaurelia TaxID=43137 RepID=A0A8S1YKL4_PAROT|nr:unnamed protein product [Paramecium octaurelia]
MNQDSKFQQSQEFKCKDHPDKPVLFWCKSVNCDENRMFCLSCQKQNKHVQHYAEDVLSFHELNSFLIEKSKLPNGPISQCQTQFQSTVQSYEKLMTGLSYKFCGLEDKINKLEPHQIQQALESLIKFEEFNNHLQNNILGFLFKFKKILDDLFNKLDLHLIQYQMTDQEIKFNKDQYQKGQIHLYVILGLSLNIRNKYNDAIQLFDKLLQTEPYNVEIMYQKGQQKLLFEANSLSQLNKLEVIFQETNSLISKLNNFMKNVFQQIKIIQQHSLEQGNDQGRLINIILHNNTIQKVSNQIHIIKTISFIMVIAQDKKRNFKKQSMPMIRFQLKIHIIQRLWQEKEYRLIIILFLGEFDEAQICIQMSISIKNNSYLGLYGQGMLLYQMNLYEKAIEQFDQALAINPQHVDSLSRKGNCLGLMNKFDQAHNWYDKALAINPQHVDSLSRKGECLGLMKKFDQAQEWYDKALAINPQHLNSLYGKGECLGLMNKFDQAQEWYEKALDINPEHVDSLSSKGECLRLMNKYDQAQICFDKVLALNPQHLSSLYGKAFILLEHNELDTAYSLFNQAYQIKPNQQFKDAFLTQYDQKQKQQ